VCEIVFRKQFSGLRNHFLLITDVSILKITRLVAQYKPLLCSSAYPKLTLD